MSHIMSYLKDEKGAAAAEYALILAIIGAGVGAAVFGLGGAISTAIGKATTCMGTPSTC